AHTGLDAPHPASALARRSRPRGSRDPRRVRCLLRAELLAGVAAMSFAAAVFAVTLAAADVDQAMIEKGVAYLASAQSEDGSFGMRGRAELGITALCIRSLAQARLEPGSPLVEKRDASVARAVKWLLERQQSDGSFTQERGGLTVYRTALAISALAA